MLTMPDKYDYQSVANPTISKGHQYLTMNVKKSEIDVDGLKLLHMLKQFCTHRCRMPLEFLSKEAK